MATTKFFNAESTNNVKNVNGVAIRVKNDVKNVSFMYFVNMLNKFAKKNEFCDNTNVKELLTAFREATGYNVFTSHVFEKDYAKRSCLVRTYKGSLTAADLEHGDTITDEKGNELILSEDGQNVLVLRPIALTRTAIIDAYKAIILPDVQVNRGRLGGRFDTDRTRRNGLAGAQYPCWAKLQGVK